ncbi:MAG: hypothetical protein ACE5H5_00940 [Nitrospinota bacterium]
MPGAHPGWLRDFCRWQGEAEQARPKREYAAREGLEEIEAALREVRKES